MQDHARNYLCVRSLAFLAAPIDNFFYSNYTRKTPSHRDARAWTMMRSAGGSWCLARVHTRDTLETDCGDREANSNSQRSETQRAHQLVDRALLLQKGGKG